MNTTGLKRPAEMHHGPLANCHGGDGILDWTIVADGKEHPRQALRMLHDDVLPPGSSIGVHEHRDEEHYYIVSGHGTMILDGIEHPVGPGDLASVYAGGSHGLVNDSDEDLRLLVIGCHGG